tara:strand:- start:703 stop:1944 length:1242 start_codon:yes stop_codon:yes gene_type:complete
MTIVKKNIIKKKFKKRGGVGCALLRKTTLGCQKVDKHIESSDPKYKKLFYDLCNLFIDNSNLSLDRKNNLKDNLKKHIIGIKPCNDNAENFTIMINGIIVNIRIKFYRDCRALLLINYNANIHFTMFSDLNESKGYNGCCSPFHLTINNPKTRAYINFEYSENLDSLADAIDATGYYIKTGKTRSTDEPISDSWSDILMNIDEYGITYRDRFKKFCDDLRDYIKRKNPGDSDFYLVRFDRHPRHRDSPHESSDRRVRSPGRRFTGYDEGTGYGYMRVDFPPPMRYPHRISPPPSRYPDERTARRRSPGRRSSDGRTARSRSPDRRYSDGRTGLGRSRDRRRSGGNLLNKKIVDSINKYFDKIKKIKQEIKILKKKKNKKKIEAKKTTIKNTLLKIKLKKEKLKKEKLKQKQKK